MNLKYCFFLNCFILNCFSTTAIHKQDVNVVSVSENADDLDVKSMFILTENGNGCIAEYHYFNKSEALSIILKGNQKSSKNDSLRVLRIIETEDAVLTAINNFKIDANGHGQNHIIDFNNMETCDKPKYDKKLNCFLAESDSDKLQPVCSGQLIFQETFSNNKLSSNWTHVQYSRLYTNHVEFVAFRKDKKNIYLENNILYLHASLPKKKRETVFNYTECTYEKDYHRKLLCGPYQFGINTILPPVHSAAITTKKTILFKYGKIEIRAKFPVGDWLFPYLLLYPSDAEFESYSIFDSHIRIAYARGNLQIFDGSGNALGGNTLYGDVVRKQTEMNESLRSNKLETGEHYGHNFHNYTLIRHRDRLIYKVDGKEYGTIDNPSILEEINKNEHYIVLGLTAGGVLNFPTEHSANFGDMKFFSPPRGAISFEDKLSDITKTWKHPKLVIEYVRVYTTHSAES